jgi:hypothetical protein
MTKAFETMIPLQVMCILMEFLVVRDGLARGDDMRLTQICGMLL